MTSAEMKYTILRKANNLIIKTDPGNDSEMSNIIQEMIKLAKMGSETSKEQIGILIKGVSNVYGQSNKYIKEFYIPIF